MWRMKVTAISLVALSALIFGSVVAYAGWGWNARVDVGGSLISTQWTVTGDEDGAADYKAKITITVPNEAEASVVEAAQNRTETVKIVHSDDLECTADGMINAMVSYKVSHRGGGDAGENVEVEVSEVDGGALGSNTGSLKETITVNVQIEGTCNG